MAEPKPMTRRLKPAVYTAQGNFQDCYDSVCASHYPSPQQRKTEASATVQYLCYLYKARPGSNQSCYSIERAFAQPRGGQLALTASEGLSFAEAAGLTFLDS